MLPTKLVIERFQFKGDLSERNHYMDNPHWINVKGFFSFTKKSQLNKSFGDMAKVGIPDSWASCFTDPGIPFLE